MAIVPKKGLIHHDDGFGIADGQKEAALVHVAPSALVHGLGEVHQALLDALDLTLGDSHNDAVAPDQIIVASAAADLTILAGGVAHCPILQGGQPLSILGCTQMATSPTDVKGPEATVFRSPV